MGSRSLLVNGSLDTTLAKPCLSGRSNPRQRRGGEGERQKRKKREREMKRDEREREREREGGGGGLVKSAHVNCLLAQVLNTRLATRMIGKWCH